MASLDLDTLFLIAEAAPALDAAEAALRKAGKTGTADALMKLQQDAGIDIEREMTGGANLDPPAGPQTAVLTSVHNEVTPARLSVVFGESYAALSPGGVKDNLRGFMQKLLTATPAIAAAAPRNTF